MDLASGLGASPSASAIILLFVQPINSGVNLAHEPELEELWTELQDRVSVHEHCNLC